MGPLLLSVFICSLTALFSTTEAVIIKGHVNCTFPFIYKGTVHKECTKSNSNHMWCSRLAVYDGNWEYCDVQVEKVEEKKDRFAELFEKIKNNTEYIKMLEEKAKQNKGSDECKCHAELDRMRMSMNETLKIVRDHERRIKDCDTMRKKIKAVDNRLTALEVKWPKIVEKVDGDNEEKSECTGSYCVTFVMKKMKYIDAEAYCKSKGGHLASVHNKATNDWISKRLIQHGGGHFWIGLNDMQKEGSYIWTDGTVYDYGNFAKNQPDNYNNAEHCIHMYTESGTQLWNDLPCNVANKFMCQKKSVQVVSNPKHKTFCRCGDLCYTFVTEKKTPMEADRYCRILNGRLTSIHSKAENEWVAAKAHSISKTFWWVGMHDMSTEGTMKVFDGSSYDYAYWNNGEPNNYKDEDCVHLGWISSTPGLWNDMSCKNKYYFVCKSGQFRPHGYPGISGVANICEGNWCYVFVNQRRNYAYANQFCSHHKGALADPQQNSSDRTFLGRTLGFSNKGRDWFVKSYNRRNCYVTNGYTKYVYNSCNSNYYFICKLPKPKIFPVCY